MKPRSGADRDDKSEPSIDMPPLLDREDERTVLADIVGNPGRHHLHIAGPRGSGKTLLTQHTIATAADGPCYYVHCTRHDTQYKILKQLYEAITGEAISTGYHTSQLQQELADLLEPIGAVIVLDEVDFLLHNDGSDLLYYLTRIANDSLSVVTISANHPDLATVIDDRIYSSLQPRCLQIDAYSPAEAARIVSHRLDHAHLRYTINREAVSTITRATTNIRLGLHWMAEALTATDGTVTADTVNAVRQDALYRYWDTLLSEFTDHHHLLTEALLHLATDTDHVNTGAVYDYYDQFCSALSTDTITSRRLSDYLKHLELLGIVKADYSYGGTEGKTRKIQLRRLC